MSTTVLITGTARGIGKGLVTKYLARDNYTVIATVRDVSHSNAKALSSLPTGAGSKLIVLSLDAGSEESVKSAISKLTSEHSISALDIVIANAGTNKSACGPADASQKEVLEDFQVNCLGPLFLYQATLPLLTKSTHSPAPAFVAISSILGSLTAMNGKDHPMPFVAYNGSKAYLNMILRTIYATNKDVIAFPIHPGWVQTDMGNAGAAAVGMEQAPETLEQSIDGITSVLDNADKETSGKFMAFDGKELPW